MRRSLGQAFRFVELANDVNEHMPDYVVKRVGAKLNEERQSVNGARILLLGLAYKKNSGDARESPAIAVAERLRSLGADVRACDPMIDVNYAPAAVPIVDLTRSELAGADLVVVLTDHDDFDWTLIEEFASKALDTRNRLRGSAAEVL